ncbi:MAG: hypothetical protein IPK32_26340 [Verrucomicrobiaceae bacterium]|nr:hypothetical protein [Verrucomicrobiaceae bacterium]
MNDAPALAAAYVSVAMVHAAVMPHWEQSDAGADAGQDRKTVSRLSVSEHARRTIRQNVGISLGSVLIMAVASLFGILRSRSGARRHEGTVIVRLNSLRLLFEKE